jgi:hypothetical protein
MLIEIQAGVTTIGEGAFACCRSLTSIKIPSSVTTIGEDAFYCCIGLVSIEIPSSVTAIGESAFSFCRSLASIEIPVSVTAIGGSAFSFCRSLKSVTIPGVVYNYNFENLIMYFNLFFRALIRSSDNIKSLSFSETAKKTLPENLAPDILSFLSPKDVSKTSLASKGIAINC